MTAFRSALTWSTSNTGTMIDFGSWRVDRWSFLWWLKTAFLRANLVNALSRVHTYSSVCLVVCGSTNLRHRCQVPLFKHQFPCACLTQFFSVHERQTIKGYVKFLNHAKFNECKQDSTDTRFDDCSYHQYCIYWSLRICIDWFSLPGNFSLERLGIIWSFSIYDIAMFQSIKLRR